MQTIIVNRYLTLALCVLVLQIPLGMHTAQADQSEATVIVPGSEGDDVIVVTDPENADTNILSDTGESSTATSTIVDALAGDDDITINNDIVATTTVITAVVIDPAASLGTATSIGTNAGAGNDTVSSFGQTTVSAVTVGAYAADIALDDSDTFDDEPTVDVSITVAAQSTGIDAGEGDDLVDSEAIIDSTATATAGGSASNLTGVFGDSITINANSSASSLATGIQSGAGDDTVINRGALGATSDSTSVALGLNATVSDSALPSREVQADIEANARSNAVSVGIDADGDATSSNTRVTTATGADTLSISAQSTQVTVSGDDIVRNSGSVVSTSSASSSGIAGSIDAMSSGTANIAANSDSSAASTAISSGGGNDDVDNQGTLSAVANATANALSATFASGANRSNANVETTANADARALGIAADGTAIDYTSTSTTTIAADSLTLEYTVERRAQRGDDVVFNDAAIDAQSDAQSGVLAVSVNIDGTANATVTSTARSSGTAIIAGGGNDTVENEGDLSAAASAQATSISGAVGQASADGQPVKVKVSAETLAESSATGIAGDGGEDDEESTTSLTISDTGLGFSFSRTSTAATGNDSIINSGAVTSIATADTFAANLSLAVKGSAQAQVDSNAQAVARGIDSGAGADSISNAGAITTVADATATTANMSFTTEGNAISNSGLFGAGTTATADAVGISSAGRVYTTATVTTINIDTEGLSGSYLTVVDGISGDGSDDINNRGDVSATSTAATVQASGAGSARGSALTLGRTEADSRAGAIESGNGDDIVTNSGALISSADASATMLDLSVAASSGLAVSGNAAWDGGTVATARSSGIDADSGTATTSLTTFEANANRAQVVYDRTVTTASGNDVITNSGSIESSATSEATTVSLAVSIRGVAAAVSTSTAESDATGIRGGDGDDIIDNGIRDGEEGNDDDDNTGRIDSTATASALTANISFTPQGLAVAADAVWDSGTTATATSIGIAGDGGNLSENTRLAIGTDEFGFTQSSVLADGSDSITNRGAVTAIANSETFAAALGVSGTGVAIATATSTANANAAAIDAGAGSGADTVDNSGDLTASANATAASTSVSVVNTGLAVAAGSVWDGGTEANATSDGIRVGGGDDVVDNTGDIDSSANANAVEVNVSFVVTGIAATTSTSTTNATATGIDAGADNDQINNFGNVTVDADSNAVAATIAVTGTGGATSLDTVWEGGTTANALATGLQAGSGDDTINSAVDTTIEGVTINVAATSTTSSVGVALSGTGIAASLTAATANAEASAIDAGSGDDIVNNQSNIISSAEATATGVSVSLVGTGVAAAGGSPLLDNSTTANALAAGIQGGSGNDTILNNADTLLDIDALADTSSDAIALTLLGISGAGLDANAYAKAYGIDGGSEDDLLSNEGELDIFASANARARSLSLASFAGLVDVSSLGRSDLFGMSGGTGNDRLENSGTINLLSTAAAFGQAITGSLVGVSISAANADSVANAAGMQGGDGADIVINDAIINVDAQATTNMRAISATLGGYSLSTANSTATVDASGMAGGAGEDILINTGNVRVGPAEDASGDDYWMAEIVANAFSFAAAGGAENESESTVRATAAGIAGGEDNDVLSNTGDVTVLATARSQLTNSSLVLFGAAGTGSESGATTLATGLDGGDGDDVVTSSGTLDVVAESMLVQRGGSANFTLAGNNDSDSGLVAATRAVGVSGGSGLDVLVTEGTIDVTARSTLDTGGGASITIFGNAEAAGTSGARTYAAGIDGGADDDMIDNDADISVAATSVLKLDRSTYTFGGAGSSGGDLTATTNAEGLVGGFGSDIIRNTGTVVVDATSDLDSRGNSNTTFGGSSAESESGARSFANGISGGDGDDVIENSEGGSVDVTAYAKILTNSVSYTFLGQPDANVAMTGTADAVGLQGGSGNNSVSNFGALSVFASTDLRASAGSKTTISGGDGGTSGGHTESTTTATGLAAADGDDRLQSTGSLTVRSLSQADTRNTANTTASLISNTGADSSATAASFATGLSAGEGQNVMLTDGNVSVRADANAYSIAYANGASVSLSGSATSTVTSNADATAEGLRAGDGNNIVVNDGAIDVTADADTAKGITVTSSIITFDELGPPNLVEQVASDIDAFGGSELPPLVDDGDYADQQYIFWTETIPDPDNPQDPPPRNDENVGPDGAYYQAIRTETTEANGDVTVSWEWRPAPVFRRAITEQFGLTASSAAGVGQGYEGNGTADATGTANASAWGIKLGDGDNFIDNNGSVLVIADADATMRTTASGGDSGNATATTRSNANAVAFGIQLGDGDNVFNNRGVLNIMAIATASAVAEAEGGDGFCFTFLFWRFCIAPGTENSTPLPTWSAAATGVETGDGNNIIINENGAEITVSAIALGGTLTATGIRTGSGDDIVINNGFISATIIRNGILSTGVGIDTGAGNDQLTLGDGSEVVGRVILGDGDDVLTLLGTPIVRDVNGNLLDLSGGAGLDTLVLQGPGFYALAPIDFERAIKNGLGTYTLPSLDTLESLRINGGTLQLNDDYAFAADGEYLTYLDSDDGSAGLLQLMGGAAALAGSIEVQRRGTDFVANGSRYSVVMATEGTTGNFASIVLPESLPLLSFELQQRGNSVDVVANASSFATVASSPLYAQVANNLFGIAPIANDDLATQLGQLQQLESGFDEAFAGFSPDSQGTLMTSAVSTGYQTTQLLQTHLSDARAVRRGQRPDAAAYEPVALSYQYGQLQNFGGALNPMLLGVAATNSGVSLTKPKRTAQTWISGFTANGEYKPRSGYTEFEHDSGGFTVGADYGFGNDLIAGFTFGIADVDIESVQAVATSNIESWSGGLYLTKFSDIAYFEASISYTDHAILNQRQLSIGSNVQTASSDYSGNTLMAFFSVGREYAPGSWKVEPFASLYHFNIHEDGYRETGAGGANFIIPENNSTTTFAEVGTRLSRLQSTGSGQINWHASAAFSLELDANEDSIFYAYEGAPGTQFGLRNRNVESNSLVIGAGLAYTRDRSTLALSYRGLFNEDYRNNIVGARLSVAF